MKNKNDEGLVSAMCQSIIEDATDINAKLEQLEDRDLPTWWTSKLAVASAYINSLRDYITYNTDDTLEQADEETEQESEETNEDSELIESDDLTDIADEMLPPSVRMMQRATKEG